jgi:hypothetical protein
LRQYLIELFALLLCDGDLNMPLLYLQPPHCAVSMKLSINLNRRLAPAITIGEQQSNLQRMLTVASSNSEHAQSKRPHFNKRVFNGPILIIDLVSPKYTFRIKEPLALQTNSSRRVEWQHKKALGRPPRTTPPRANRS